MRTNQRVERLPWGIKFGVLGGISGIFYGVHAEVNLGYTDEAMRTHFGILFPLAMGLLGAACTAALALVHR